MAQKVREVMTVDPIALQAGASIQEAASQMREQGIGSVPVVDDGRILGMITDRDIVIRTLADGRDPVSMTVGEICSDDLVFVTPEEDADRAVELMRMRAVRRIPVVEGTALVGVLSIGDMALERDETSALADISSAPPNL